LVIVTISLFTPSAVDALALVTAEGARVEVLNGAGLNGLAQATT
jgi:hypothetical protein